MDLVLAVLVLGVAEVVVVGAAFRVFDRAEQRRAAEAEAEARTARSRRVPGRFFGDAPALGAGDRETLEALLLQLERHVRLEQAAAESFLHNPTPESLHRRPASPLHLAH